MLFLKTPFLIFSFFKLSFYQWFLSSTLLVPGWPHLFRFLLLCRGVSFCFLPFTSKFFAIFKLDTLFRFQFYLFHFLLWFLRLYRCQELYFFLQIVQFQANLYLDNLKATSLLIGFVHPFFTCLLLLRIAELEHQCNLESISNP